MRSPAYLAQPNVQRLPSLLRDIQEGEIRIPRFQRPFVWTPEQRLDLFRSIYDGIPIGSILIWRTKEHVLRCYDHLGPLRLAWAGRDEEEEGRQVRQYVIDGHQRLTTLFAALGEGLMAGELAAEPAAAVQDEELQADGTWPIYFDLEERDFRVHRRSGEPPGTWLPLSILLDPYKLFELQKRLLDRDTDRALVNRAESLASTFKDYSIPVVPIVTEDLELATESFQRVNSGGTPMNEVHMISGLIWSPGFDLNERMKEIRIELGEVGWQDLEEKMILNTCKAALDLDIYYAETRAIRDAIKDRPQVLREATDSLKAAARFLRERCKVYGPAVLPYSFQIVLLADAINRGTDGLHRELSPEASDALERWFWLTTYGEYFAGISAVRLGRARDHLRKVAANGGDPEPPGLSREVSSPRRFDFRAARSRAIALRMASLQPQSGSAEPQDPYQLLADYGRDAMPMLLPSREVRARSAEGPENRILVHPKEAASVRRRLNEPGQCPPDFLASFAINEEAASALARGNLSGFLFLRRMALLRLEEDFVEQIGLEYRFDADLL